MEIKIKWSPEIKKYLRYEGGMLLTICSTHFTVMKVKKVICVICEVLLLRRSLHCKRENISTSLRL